MWGGYSLPSALYNIGRFERYLTGVNDLKSVLYLSVSEIKTEPPSLTSTSSVSTPSSTTISAPLSSSTPIVSTMSQAKLHNAPAPAFSLSVKSAQTHSNAAAATTAVSSAASAATEKSETAVKLEEKKAPPVAHNTATKQQYAPAAPVASELPTTVTSQTSAPIHKTAPLVAEKSERKRVKQKSRHKKHHKVHMVCLRGAVLNVQILYFAMFPEWWLKCCCVVGTDCRLNKRPRPLEATGWSTTHQCSTAGKSAYSI